MNEINENLQRIRTLSNQAVTGTNSDTDLQSIQNEIKERLEEINRVSEQTQFNGVKVLGEANNTLKIQVGAHDGQTIDINLSKIDQESLGLAGFKITNGATAVKVGDKLTAKVGGADTEFTFSAAPATGAASKDIALPTIANPTGVATGGTNELVRAGESSDYYVKHTADDKTVSYHKATIAVAAGADAVAGPPAEVAKAPELTVTAGDKLTDSELETAGLAPATDKPLAAIDGALKQVDELRSHLGAIQNRFQSTIANLNNTVNNLSAARSRIEDADYAVEVSNMTRSQILQQAGTSVLAQANQVPQTVLSLLR